LARTREFDIDQATDQALQLFWSKGYEGTSLEDLTTAMGINRPSLYAAFGSKEGLFKRALERYLVGHDAAVATSLAADSAREVAFRIMRWYADAVGLPGRPPCSGCFLVQGALVSGDENRSIRRVLAERRRRVEAAFAARFERAKREGDLASDARPADLARYVMTICHGLSVLAVGGASRDQLRRVVEIAMRSWPD
jgi:AcrR family transcriptional regulator